LFQLNLPGWNQPIPEPSGFKFSGADATIGAVLSSLLTYLYPLAGLILFINLLAAGFGFLTAAGNPEGLKKAQARLFSSFIGFFLLFLSFWLIQLIQEVFGLGKIF